MSAPYRTIVFPAEWIGVNEVTQASVAGEWVDHATGDRLWCSRVTLDDGTQLLALSWPRGSHFMRVGPTNDWALEEKLAPPSAVTPMVRRTWRAVVNTAANEIRLALAETKEAS